MAKALIVSNIKKHLKYFEFMLKSVNVLDITIKNTAKETREIIIEEFFDIIIIDSPLIDELGKNLSKELNEKIHGQIIYCVDNESLLITEEELFNLGINVLSKPFNRKVFSTMLKTCITASFKINTLSSENKILNIKIEELKVIDKAKYLLISYLKMTETEAHKYIEKQAMNNRVSKYEIARKILKTYVS